MKANETPDKIYVTECMLFMTNPEITLQGNGNKIEYARTDAFIDKACKWLEDNLYDYAGKDDKLNIVPFDKSIFEDFKSYMKGE